MPFCTYGRCGNPRHDHTTALRDDGMPYDIPVPMRCLHCGLPSHYDEAVSDYQHDDPAAPDCFLIKRYVPHALSDGTPVRARGEQAAAVAGIQIPRPRRGRHRA